MNRNETADQFSEIGTKYAKEIAEIIESNRSMCHTLSEIETIKEELRRVYHEMRAAKKDGRLNKEDLKLIGSVFNAYEWLDEIYDNLDESLWDYAYVRSDLIQQAEKNRSSDVLLDYEPRFNRSDIDE